MDLTGFSLEPLHDDGDMLLCRARKPGAPGSVLALVAAKPASHSISRLEREYGLASLLDPEWAAQPLALDLSHVPPVLILDDSGGAPLSRLLNRPLALPRFLRIAASLAQAIARAHARGILHKDIKPANVLVDASDNVRLTGFGIAAMSRIERDAAASSTLIRGTLMYMAPEQTGRMNRPPDERSDLYSFGVVCYEMLTGTPPFSASDPIEWIHCHVARRPVPPSERVQDLPLVVEHIVEKLLAKNPEDRYQTATGVHVDLLRCLSEWETHHAIAPFALGTRDASYRIQIPEKLHGRDAQIDQLIGTFDEVATKGDTQVVFLSGYAGVGKSSMVSHLQSAVAGARPLFATGKFDQYRADTPYVPLVQAFQSLVRDLLVSGDRELEQWQHALTEALAPNGQLMLNLVPELALIIGEQPAVPDLSADDARNRLYIAFRRFLSVFAQPGHPLVLFIDDLQWHDAATLDFFVHLATHRDIRNMLLIGAYRDNEAGSQVRLATMIDDIRKAGSKPHLLELLPLSMTSAAEFVGDLLRCPAATAAPLAELVHEKTGGNPFYLVQFLTALADDGLIVFDHQAGIWTWSLPRIRDRELTDNVADLMAAKLYRLPHATREVLSQLAILGNIANLDALARTRDEPRASVDMKLWDAVNAGLLHRVGDAFMFAHDRVQEAAYALIPEADRPAAHLQLGRALASEAPADAADPAIFDIVNHLNRGASLMTDEAERQRTVALNFAAGRRAMNSAAFASARNYLSNGVALIAENAWSRDYDGTFDLYLAFAECQFVMADFADADALFDAILGRARSNLYRARVHALRMELYQVAGRYDESFDVAREALREFGVLLPSEDEGAALQFEAELRDVAANLAGRAIDRLVDAPVASDDAARTIVDLLVESMPCAFIARPAFYPLVTLKAVNLSLRAGNTDRSSFAYGNYALILVSRIGDIVSAVQFSEMSLRLNERFDNRRFQGKLLHLHGNHINFWRRHISTDLAILERASAACLDVGDLAFAGYLAFTTVWQTIEKGAPLADVQRTAQTHAAFAQQSHNDAVYETIRLQQGFVAALQGQSGHALDDDASLAVVMRANFGCGIAFCHIMRMIHAFMDGRYRAALGAAREAQSTLNAVMALPIEPTFHFFHALTLVALDASENENQQAESRRVVHAVCDKFELWAKHCPANFQHRHALLRAEVARVEGRDSEAMLLYEEAVRLAREHGFIHVQALSHELAGRFYAERGLGTIADSYMLNARACYERWGATGKVDQLVRRYTALQQDAFKSDGAISTSSEQLDLATVVSVSRSLFSGLDMNELIHTLMRLALEHAGGSRCVLILKRPKGLVVEAEAATCADGVDVRLPKIRFEEADLPESVLRYVIRASDSLLLDDASAVTPYSLDDYIRRHGSRSILCLPLIKQARLIGVLYLENNLASNAFTPARTAMLRLLATQAAMSLESARLYADLQNAEALLAEAQRLSSTGSFDWHVRSGELFWSRESFRIFEYEGTTTPTIALMLARVHPEDAAYMRLVLDRATRDREPLDVECRLLLPDGSVRHLQLIARVVVDAHAGMRVVGALKDITTRKRAHAALARSEHRYRTLFFDMPVGLWQVDAQPLTTLLAELRAEGVYDVSRYIDEHPGWLDRAMELLRVDEVNIHAAQMFGARDRTVLLGPLRWLWRERPDTFRRVLESRYGGASLFQEQTRLPTLDGRIIDVLLTVAHPGGAEESGMVLISLVDLTERIRAEELLQQLQAEFAHAARVSMLGELTASIAHELKQPLAAIRMNSSLGNRWLDRSEPDIAEARLVNQHITVDAQRAVEIVDRIHAMATRRELKRVAAPLDPLVDEALLFLHHELHKRGIAIVRKRAAGVPVVIVDRVQLQQVVVNLVVNAMQAMEAAAVTGGQITVATHALDTSSVTCSVEDGGPGIDLGNVKRVFESFYTTKAGGMGMGLAISRSIIEMHGGTIAADNASAHGGARFFFTLPLAASSAEVNEGAV